MAVLNRDSKIELIRGVPLFARCAKRQLAEVAKLADEIDMPAGAELVRQGEFGREFFVIVRGEAEVRRHGRRINGLGPGEFFGEIALLTRAPRTATVRAVTDMDLLVLTAPSFRALLDDQPSIAGKVLEALGLRLFAEGTV